MSGSALDGEAVRPNKWVAACFTTAEGKEICFYLPTWEPHIDPPDIEYPVEESRWRSPVITTGLGSLEDPRPVPWVVDLGLIAAAWGVAGSLQNAEAAEVVQGALKRAAETIAAEAPSALTLHFPV